MDARTMVPQDTVRGLTGEAALTVLADGKTVMAIARTDGDCTCGMARVGPEQQPECGIYRYYYQVIGHACAQKYVCKSQSCMVTRRIPATAGRAGAPLDRSMVSILLQALRARVSSNL